MSAQSQIFNPTLRTSQASGEGFACPTMNTASRLAIVFGASDKGMMVYDTTLANVYYWNGTAWVALGGGGLVPVGASLNTQVIYNNAGVLEGDTGLTFNNVTDALTVVGPATVQGMTVSKGLGAAASNTAFGVSVLGANTGTSNTGFGSNALVAMQGGVGNSAFGTNAIFQNISGNNNTAIGSGNILLQNISGSSNTGVGASCLGAATGSFLTAVGQQALSNLVAGDSNTAIGYFAGAVHSSGANNAFFGAGSFGDSNSQSNIYNYGDASVTSHKFRNGNVVLGAGNVVLALAQGIDFSATAGIGTSELLNDYEEGTWTPTDSSGALLVFGLTKCRYTKIGRAVTIQGQIQYPITASAAPAGFSSFPFLSADMLPLYIAYDGGSTAADSLYGLTTFVNFYLTGTIVLNSALSGVTVSFSGTYMT